MPSAPVIPHGDATLLFTNAGMNQFKDVFLGTGSRPYTRAADTQKCIRVSGKHNDLEEVGRDTYHHTFFEMLGNWSFGDYFKEEAIEWSFELLTTVWGLDKTRLHATVYRTDDESYEIWKKYLPESHIHRFDEKDNFWEMGDTGPCGPCTEIHYDYTPDCSGGPLVNAGDARVIEIWNNVFIQYNRKADGTLEELPSKHVDTGMGLERIAALLQGVGSNYDIDIFRSIIAHTERLSGKGYRQELDHPDGIAMRVIADHIRTLSFAIADGTIPGNEGRGYVLRRILRRAARYAGNLGFTEPVLWKHVDVLCSVMGSAFPEIQRQQELITKIIKAEEEQFLVTLDNGRNELLLAWQNLVAVSLPDGQSLVPGQSMAPDSPIEVAGADGKIHRYDNAVRLADYLQSPVLSGAVAFKLYDTYGFPIDLTELIAAEEYGLTVNKEHFTELLNEQRTRSRAARKLHVNEVKAENLGVQSRFVGYNHYVCESPLLYISENEVVVEETPFYVEMGGQVSDIGTLTVGGTTYDVDDVRKVGDAIVHLCETVVDAAVGHVARVEVNVPRRRDIQREHSATHLLHEALRRVLGSHVQQSGSLVAPDHLRFDFSHYERLHTDQLTAIESMVNDYIFKNISVSTEELAIEKARTIPNVKMFFGDKYGSTVRVVTIDPDFSVEFCGGTHVQTTGEIGLFKIVGEESVAAGVRRIEAIVGTSIPTWITRQTRQLTAMEEEHVQLTEKIRQLEKDLLAVRTGRLKQQIPQLVQQASVAGDLRIVATQIQAESAEQLKDVADELRLALKHNGVGLLASVIGDKVQLVCVVTDDRTGQYSAGSLVGRVAKELGGGGGGKPHMATAGARNTAGLSQALTAFVSQFS